MRYVVLFWSPCLSGRVFTCFHRKDRKEERCAKPKPLSPKEEPSLRYIFFFLVLLRRTHYFTVRNVRTPMDHRTYACPIFSQNPIYLEALFLIIQYTWKHCFSESNLPRNFCRAEAHTHSTDEYVEAFIGIFQTQFV